MYSKLRWLILLFVTGFILESPCWAASVTVAIPAVDGSAGTQVRVPVLVREAQGVGALELELTYDPSVLEAQSVEPGPILSGLVDFNVVQPGRLKIAMATSQAVNGSGELFLVMLKVLSSGQSRLGLEKVAAWEQANSQEMTVSLEPGAFKTSGGAAVSSGSSYLTLGISLIVLVIATLGFFFRKKLFTALGKAGASSHPGAAGMQQQWGANSPMSYPVGGLRCLECGQILSLDSMFCRTCGATVKPPPVTMKCHECGRLMPEDSKFCPYCGKPFRVNEKDCPQCGKTISEQARFCSDCGAKLA
jgi:RNA polymerase subunit RPABC4/transcription elongation factor Spt4